MIYVFWFRHGELWATAVKDTQNLRVTRNVVYGAELSVHRPLCWANVLCWCLCWFCCIPLFMRCVTSANLPCKPFLLMTRGGAVLGSLLVFNMLNGMSGAILMTWKNKLGNSDTLANWGSSSDPCASKPWFHILCNTAGHIQRLWGLVSNTPLVLAAILICFSISWPDPKIWPHCWIWDLWNCLSL